MTDIPIVGHVYGVPSDPDRWRRVLRVEPPETYPAPYVRYWEFGRTDATEAWAWRNWAKRTDVIDITAVLAELTEQPR